MLIELWAVVWTNWVASDMTTPLSKESILPHAPSSSNSLHHQYRLDVSAGDGTILYFPLPALTIPFCCLQLQAKSKNLMGHVYTAEPRSASAVVPSPDTCLWYVRVSLGCAPTCTFASPTSSHLRFMGNKLGPKDNHDTFFQTPKQGTHCRVFHTCILHGATCPGLF